jgi:hypothetical protein
MTLRSTARPTATECPALLSACLSAWDARDYSRLCQDRKPGFWVVFDKATGIVIASGHSPYNPLVGFEKSRFRPDRGQLILQVLGIPKGHDVESFLELIATGQQLPIEEAKEQARVESRLRQEAENEQYRQKIAAQHAEARLIVDASLVKDCFSIQQFSEAFGVAAGNLARIEGKAASVGQVLNYLCDRARVLYP